MSDSSICPGRPAVKFIYCANQMKELTGDRQRLGAEEVKNIKIVLASQGFSEIMIKKARIHLGYKSFQILDYPYGITWIKGELPN